MNFRQHLLAGTATSLIVGGISMYMTRDIRVAGIFVIVTIAGSLISDVDTGSIPSRIFAWIGIIASILLIQRGYPKPAAIIGIVYMAFSSDHHRGFTHKWILPYICFAAGIFAYFYQAQYGYLGLCIPFGLGLATHFIIDKIPPYKII